MDVVERLTLEAAQADTMLACEHRHRYGFASELCAGLRVLDLCCGSGYGTQILAARAAQVLGVDIDMATVETARFTVGSELPNVSFEPGDALRCLRGELAERFDAIVCFEGLEHLHGLEEALRLLQTQAQRGLRIVASVPNDKLFQESNPFHVTEFGYDEAWRVFASFPDVVMVPQFLAEGSLICPEGAEDTQVAVTLADRQEPEYANHFIFCVNFAREELTRAHHGRIQVNTSPVFNRWAEDLKRGAWSLRRENARLARCRLGKGGSAAASALARVAAREMDVSTLEQRCARAEARVAELEAELLDASAGEESIGVPDPPDAIPVGNVEEIDASSRPFAPGENPNSWEHRRRRAAETLIPWVERTFPLAGKTVLEYGCGNAAVSSAFAERALRVIGVDIDPGWIELGRQELSKRGVANVELELHDVERILEAVSGRRGTIDVFLLYAVLEHLTVAERLAVLRLAREVVAPGGVIVVCETPNRLTYFDHHTAQMPFFHLLPEDLAAEYYGHSEREDLRESLAEAELAGPPALHEAVVRWGRGVSFHEFEVVFGDLSRHVLASSYDPVLFRERPIHPEEVVLARYLDRVRPDLAPAWSRQWLDLILSPQALEHRPAFVWPWIAETTESHRVGWNRWENLHLPGGDAVLWMDLPRPTTRLVVGAVTQEGRALGLRARPDGARNALGAELEPPAHVTGFVSLSFSAPTRRVALTATAPCDLVFVGYEG